MLDYSPLEQAIYTYAAIGLTGCVIVTALLLFLTFASVLEWTCEKLAKRYFIYHCISLIIGICSSKIYSNPKVDKGYILAQLLARFESMQKENPELAEKFIQKINERNISPSPAIQAAEKLDELLNH